MNLQTDIAIGSTNSIGIMNQVHYIHNLFNFSPLSLLVVNNFTIWYPCPQLHKTKFITSSYKERHIMYKLHQNCTPHYQLYQNCMTQISLDAIKYLTYVLPNKRILENTKPQYPWTKTHTLSTSAHTHTGPPIESQAINF